MLIDCNRQCYTHRFLGWKMRVVDGCDAAGSSSDRKSTQVEPDNETRVESPKIRKPSTTTTTTTATPVRVQENRDDANSRNDYDTEYYDDDVANDSLNQVKSPSPSVPSPPWVK